MSKERKWPVTLSVDIEHKGLKRVVEEGRLMEFVHAFSSLAGEYIRVQLVDELAKAGVGLTKIEKDFSIDIGFNIDDDYGTGPPKPWPKVIVSAAMEQELRNIVRQEIALTK
ncbi:MAG: hypothetical protein ACFE95_08300 [Candidatus Hodarchaeota archaeon]